MLWSVRIAGGFLVLVTLLPLLPTGKWYVRWWDFPRLQIAALLLVPLLIVAWQVLRTKSWEPSIWATVLLAALVWQVSHIVEFSPLWAKEIPASNGQATTIKLMVANLDYENSQPKSVGRQLAEESPNVLLLVEYDQDWHERLGDLRATFEYHHEEIHDKGLGMALWSNIPITQSETQFLVSDRRPSIWATLKLDSGQQINYVGVHPTPPGLLDSTGNNRRDSRVRDAELIMVAKEVADRSGEAWAIAGDFNDVAWSHTTRLFKRVSGLRDPRIGRSFMGTYMAEYPPCRCPIDHVFLSEGFSIANLARKRISGSDHFAVLATVSLGPDSGVTPEPQGDDKEDARELIQGGKTDAAERGLDE